MSKIKHKDKAKKHVLSIKDEIIWMDYRLLFLPVFCFGLDKGVEQQVRLLWA
ncbi:hypothetical protein M2281_005168 [Mesorhizobium soli]|uniref:hypothetical protein n=1 Tax=Pseudaminobacter soli (ex Li et al. 2025) TaxID=1295366 RepID=UPI002473E674|nr:hypothetical protein [Mesorhizobium soli]MDH6234550.1 hypothetical protein [Mesorhizobium soli]